MRVGGCIIYTDDTMGWIASNSNYQTPSVNGHRHPSRLTRPPSPFLQRGDKQASRSTTTG